MANDDTRWNGPPTPAWKFYLAVMVLVTGLAAVYGMLVFLTTLIMRAAWYW